MVLLIILSLVSDPPYIKWTAVPGGLVRAVDVIGDVNGNGTEDIVACGAHGSPVGLRCFDGFTGSEIWQNLAIPGVIDFRAMCALPDVDLDGIADVAIGTEMGSGEFDGCTIVVSGADGQILWHSHWLLPDSYSARDLDFTQNSDGTVVAVHASVSNQDGWARVITYEAATGDSLWYGYSYYTEEQEIEAGGDFSGNGFGEVGYMVDRGTAWSGEFHILDGLTGLEVGGADAVFPGDFDISDTPAGYYVVSQGGGTAVRLYQFPSGSLLWSIDWISGYGTAADLVHFLPPDAMSWGEDSTLDVSLSNNAHTCIIDGDYGEVWSDVTYPSTVRWVESIYTGPSSLPLYLVLTSQRLYVDDQYCELPQSTSDMCLVESDAFPTPLAIISMPGPGPGLAAVATSWGYGIEEDPAAPALVVGPCYPNPGAASCSMSWASGSTGQTSIRVYEASGRLRLEQDLGITPEGQNSTQLDLQELPSGCYLVVVSCGTERASTKLAVLR